MVTYTAKFIVLWGWFLVVGPCFLCFSSSSNSNQSNSNQLLSCVHALDTHVSFIASAVRGDNTTALAWFKGTEAKLRKKLGVKNSASALARNRDLCNWVQKAQREISQADNQKYISFFDISRQKDALGWTRDLFKTKVFAAAWEQVLKTGSFDAVMACWKAALVAFVQGDDTKQFEALFKDVSIMAYLMHAYFISCCKEYCVIDARLDGQAMMNLIEICNTINALPIERTVQEIVNLIKDFMNTIGTLNQNAEDHFVDWLKSKWVHLPLAVGVMIVKIVQCFSAHKTMYA